MKKSLAFLLVLALAVCMLPGLALAEETEPTFAEDDLKKIDIPDNLVTVNCATTGDSKNYGAISGGFDMDDAKPYEEDGVWKVVVKLKLSAYKSQYDAETGTGHKIADLEIVNVVTSFTLKYVNNAWTVDGKFPSVSISVTCDGEHEAQPQPDTFPGVITVKKTVDSNVPADKNKEFNFKVTVLIPIDPNPDPSGPPNAKSANAVKAPAVRAVDKTATNKDFKQENNGDWTFYFTLKDGDTMTISNLPVGFTYRVEELDADGYTVTVNNETTTSKDVGLTKENPTETLNFKNTRGSTPTPTPTPYTGGGHGHYHPSATPVPVMVIPPKTGDMTLLQYIARLLGLVR